VLSRSNCVISLALALGLIRIEHSIRTPLPLEASPLGTVEIEGCNTSGLDVQNITSDKLHNYA